MLKVDKRQGELNPLLPAGSIVMSMILRRLWLNLQYCKKNSSEDRPYSTYTHVPRSVLVVHNPNHDQRSVLTVAASNSLRTHGEDEPSMLFF